MKNKGPELLFPGHSHKFVSSSAPEDSKFSIFSPNIKGSPFMKYAITNDIFYDGIQQNQKKALSTERCL